MRTMPRLSVITIVLNDLEGLQRTHSSLEKLNLDFEWVVVDGASKDGTSEWLQELDHAELRFVSEPDSGIYDAMNKGWRMAQGDWILNLNAGDQLTKNLENILPHAGTPSPPDVITGRVALLDHCGQPTGHFHPALGATRTDMITSNCIAHQASVVRRNLFERFGPYSVKFRTQGDFEYWVRLQKGGAKFEYIEDELAAFASGGVSSQRSNYLSAERERREILLQHGILNRQQATLKAIQTVLLFYLKSCALVLLSPTQVKKLKILLGKRDIL